MNRLIVILCTEGSVICDTTEKRNILHVEIHKK